MHRTVMMRTLPYYNVIMGIFKFWPDDGASRKINQERNKNESETIYMTEACAGWWTDSAILSHSSTIAKDHNAVV